MSESKLESVFELRRKFAGRLPLRPSARFLHKSVYAFIFSCPFALHPIGLPVAASSLPELRDA